MNSTQIMGCLVFLILILIFCIHMHRLNKKKKKPTTFKSVDHIIEHNKSMYQEFHNTLTTLQRYLAFLNAQLPNTLPEVIQEKKTTINKIQFLKSVLSVIKEHDARQEITTELWAKYLGIAHIVSIRRGTINYNDPKLEEVIDRELESLISTGHLPVSDAQYIRPQKERNSSTTSSTEKTLQPIPGGQQQ